MRVAAFTKYDREAASTRQRVLQYLPHLARAGIEVDVFPLLGGDYVRNLATGSGYSKSAILSAYLSRFRQLRRAERYDLLWVYAELFPYLPGTFERLAFGAGRPLVYDCDDAFYLPYEGLKGPARRLLAGKLDSLLRGAAAVCCGNEYLREWAARLCDRTMILPTVVDADLYRPAPDRRDPSRPVIGWIGSPSTWRYVQPMLPLLQRVSEKHGARIRIVGAGAQAAADAAPYPAVDLVEWREDTEITEVQRMDIGIMPLPEEPWARGKSGYKLIQYMACGLPVVASPVGVNSEIVRQGQTGFLATSVAEWESALSTLLTEPDLRERMGATARQRAVEEYSLQVQAPRLTAMFETVLQA